MKMQHKILETDEVYDFKKGVISMEKSITNFNEMTRILDRGIDDMEAGREFTIDDAFKLIAELIEKRKRERR